MRTAARRRHGRPTAQAWRREAGSPAFQVIDRLRLAAELRQPLGYFNSQLRRNNLETALALDAWWREYRLTV